MTYDFLLLLCIAKTIGTVPIEWTVLKAIAASAPFFYHVLLLISNIWENSGSPNDARSTGRAFPDIAGRVGLPASPQIRP